MGDLVSAIGAAEHAARLESLRGALAESGADVAYVTGAASVRYLCGFAPLPDERLCALLLPVASEPVLVVSALEEAHARDNAAGIPLRTFSDADGPAQVLSDMLAATAPAVLAVEKSVVTVAEWERLGGIRSGLGYVDLSPVLARLRMVKSTAELGRLRAAAGIADRVVSELASVLEVGARERELALEVDRLLRRHGSEQAAFPSLVLSGPTGAMPHGVPGDRPLAAGDLVIVDCGAMVDGYLSDLTRTFSIGDPGPRALELHAAVRDAQAAGCCAARAGTACSAVDRVTRGVIAQAGLGEWFVHRTGHGLGLEEHELPSLVEGDETELLDDMVVTVEPGVYLPGFGGVRIEDAVVVTEVGDARLTSAPRDLVVCR